MGVLRAEPKGTVNTFIEGGLGLENKKPAKKAGTKEQIVFKTQGCLLRGGRHQLKALANTPEPR